MENKDLILQRIFDNNESTIGSVVYENKLMYTLEDTARDIKIKGKTRIPAGRYKLATRIAMSGKTKEYRARYDWFRWHIELQNVQGFKYIYMHIGNDSGDTDGCILCAEYPNNNSENDGFIYNSTEIFKGFYLWLLPKLKAGEEIYIQIRDEVS